MVCNLNTHCAQRWHRLCGQASKQNSDTDVIIWQVIVDSTSNVTILSGKKSDDVLMQVTVSNSTMHL